MRGLALLFVLTVAGCGSGEPTGTTATGTLAFALDQTTCADQERDIELFIDAESQGVFHFTAGDSRRFAVSAGPHVASAKESGGSQTNFGTRTITVPRDGLATFALQCGG